MGDPHCAASIQLPPHRLTELRVLPRLLLQAVRMFRLVISSRPHLQPVSLIPLWRLRGALTYCTVGGSPRCCWYVRRT